MPSSRALACSFVKRSMAKVIDVRGRGVDATVMNPPFVQVQTRQD